MKAFVMSAAILAATVTVATAQPKQVRDSMAQMPQHHRTHKAMASANDVMVDGRVIGRDPSVHIRSAIANEYHTLSAASMEGGGDMGGGGGGDAQ